MKGCERVRRELGGEERDREKGRQKDRIRQRRRDKGRGRQRGCDIMRKAEIERLSGM